MKICIVKLSSLGDIAHSLFVSEIIKKNIQNSQIHWYCDTAFQQLVNTSPYNDKIIPIFSKNFKKNIIKFIKQLFVLKVTGKTEKYDIVVDLQGTFKSALVAKMLCNNQNLWGFKYTRDVIANKLYKKYCTTPIKTNIYKRNFSIINNALKLNLHFKGIKTYSLTLAHLSENNKPNILIFPSSSNVLKNYSQNNYRNLIEKIKNKYNITLLYGNDYEKNICQNITKGIDDIKIIGNISIVEVVELIKLSNCVIGADTGILHIASIFEIKNIILYGITPSYRTSINQSHSKFLQGNGDINKIPVKYIIKELDFLNI